MNSNDKPIWYSPVRVLTDYTATVSKFGVDAVNEQREFAKVIEARAVAVLCLGLYSAFKCPWFMQLCDDDPPDAVIMRVSPDTPGTIEKVRIEVTSYFQHGGKQPTTSLLEQLKTTKTFEKYDKYDKTYAILIEIGYGYTIDYREIYRYLRSINAPYQVWTVQVTSYRPYTIVQLATCSHGYGIRKLNIGEAADNFRKAVGLDTVHTIRSGNLACQLHDKSEPVEEAIWD
jgi:hypothetical protein